MFEKPQPNKMLKSQAVNNVITNEHRQQHNYCYFSSERIDKNNTRQEKFSVCQISSARKICSQKNNQLFTCNSRPDSIGQQPHSINRIASGSCLSPEALTATSNLSSLFVNEQTKLRRRRRRDAIVQSESRRQRRQVTIAKRATFSTTMNSSVSSSSNSRNNNFVFLLSLLLFVVGQLFLSQANGIKLQPEGKEKFYWSGEQFVITCQNNNNIKNVKIRWIGPNGSYITEDRSQRIHAESSGPHGHRLVVMNATVGQDDGHYKCVLGSTDDRMPRENTTFNLQLFQTTSFEETQRQLVLPMGPNGGTLNCHVKFDPRVVSGSVSWHRDGKPIEMLNDSTYQVNDYDPGRQLSQLIIRPVQRDHAARYTCRAVAVTSELSKISDFDIELTVNFAPQFDQTKQIVWVESGQSVANRNSASSGPGAGSPTKPTGRHTTNYRLQKFPHFPQHTVVPSNQEPLTQAAGNNETANSAGPQTIRVELRCTCQANPPASILWTSTQRSNFLLSKGEPAHVLEEPRVETNGYNTTSTLVIGYLLDPNWPYRRDNYICSASNKLGEATKTFTIEQGDPPPAFHVDKTKVSYNPQTALIRFTILSVAGQADAGNRQQQQLTLSDIMPPVDSFRIRAESPSPSQVTQSSGSATASHHGQSSQPAIESRVSYSRRQLEPSVEWSLDQSSSRQQQHNFTVNLGRLPAGQQRLFLEAHNAVGWSPNSTYLGEYYLVSGVGGLLQLNSLVLLTVQLIASLYLVM